MKYLNNKNKRKNKLTDEKILFYESLLLNAKAIVDNDSITKLNELDKYILELNVNNEDRANMMLYTSVYLVERGFYDKASRYLKIIEKIEEKSDSVKDNYKKTQAKIKIRKITNKNRSKPLGSSESFRKMVKYERG